MIELETILQNEARNKSYIYLYYSEESAWWAFGHSAFFLSLLQPSLKAMREYDPSYDMHIVSMPVPEDCLPQLLESYKTLVNDDFIRVEVPATTYRHRNGFEEWCGTIAMRQTI